MSENSLARPVSVVIIRRRPQPLDEILSRKDLAELQSRLSMMGTSALQGFTEALTSFAGSTPNAALPSARTGNILKRQLVHVGAFNLSLILRKLLGAGTLREWKNRFGSLF